MLATLERLLLRVDIPPQSAYRRLGFGVLMLLGFSILSTYNYLLFHSTVEIFSIVIVTIIFVITWNSKEFLNNNYLLFLGVTLIFSSSLGLLHTLAYQGIGVFAISQHSANPATQLWLAAKFLQAFSFLIAPFFINRRLRIGYVMTVYALLALLAALVIFYTNLFPVAYIDGIGLTPFKKISELLISAIFLSSLLSLIRNQQIFTKQVFRLITVSILVTVASEILSASYLGVYSVINTFGHVLNIAAFYLLYEAFIVTGFKNPYGLILQAIKKKNESVEEALKSSQLHEAETEALFQSAQEALGHHNFKISAREISESCRRNMKAEFDCVELVDNGTTDEVIYTNMPDDLCPASPTTPIEIKELKKKAYSLCKPTHRNNLTGEGLSNILFAPLVIHSKTVGFMTLANKPGGFSKSDLRKADSFARIASIALHNELTVEELASSEQRFRSLTQSATDAIISIDNSNQITYWNSGAKTIFGYDEKEVANQPFRNLVTEAIELDQNTMGKIIQMEGIRKNGNKFPIEMSFSAWKVNQEQFHGAIIRDITARVNSEQKLKDYADKIEQEKARDEALLLSIADGLLVTDATGEIIFVNKALEKICGKKAKDVLNRDLDEAIPFFDELGEKIPKEERPVYLAIDSRADKKLPILSEKTLYCVQKSGRKIPLAASAAPFVINGKIGGAVVIWRDISKEKEVEKAKNEFISFAAHQLRTPLTTVSLSIDMLLNHSTGNQLNKEQKSYLKTAFGGIKEMVDLIEALLNISRIQMGTLNVSPEPISLPKLVGDILKNSALNLKERKITVEKKYSDDLTEIEMDRRLIKLVLDNVISNAIKYSPTGSSVLISIRETRDEAVVTVSDTGYGIPKELQTKIFEKFFRADNQGKIKGTGLGLYMAKVAIEQYGGKIWCKSPSNLAFKTARIKQTDELKGTTFYVKIPLTVKSVAYPANSL